MIHHDILKFVYRSLNGFTPTHFRNYFRLNSSVHGHATRLTTDGAIFQSIKNTLLYGLRSIKYFGAKLWNNIPIYIKTANSFNIFNFKLKEFLIKDYDL